MHSDFFLVSLIWLAILFVTVIVLWRQRERRIGVVLTYLIFLTASHALQGLIYAFDWYTPLYEPEIVLTGYQLSAIALVSFVTGALLFAPIMRGLNRKVTAGSLEPEPKKDRPNPPAQLPAIYIVTGTVSYFVLMPLFGAIPTAGAFLTGLQRLYFIGLILALWRVLSVAHAPGLGKLIVIGILTLLWPVITIANEGFLGFGLVPITLIVVFVIARIRTSKLVPAFALLLLYIGLSVVVTYFSERNLIRSISWSGADTETRLTTVIDVFGERFQLFDPINQAHLEVIDGRLALNRLAGLGVEQIESGVVDFAYGQTMGDAVLMMLPRALWPDKPTVVGGQALVNKYTGVYMLGSTSVALGQVLEFYVNFGVVGVVVGFAGLGVLLSVIDRRIMSNLRSGNLFTAALWLAPVFGLWLVEDNLITAVGSAVSAVLTVAIFNACVRIALADRPQRTGAEGATWPSRKVHSLGGSEALRIQETKPNSPLS